MTFNRRLPYRHYLNRVGTNSRTCSTCGHDGQCDGLPYCGGGAWTPAYAECEICGEFVPADGMEDHMSECHPSEEEEGDEEMKEVKE